jgi:hypothetical protein
MVQPSLAFFWLQILDEEIHRRKPDCHYSQSP